ncbi:hypothetical protein QFZ46_000210 [Microbacterium murale]|uniref:Uncharacterized protein n=1 Tax=Microbacterium murale TaxID=1081040 RepID=A0ABU0P3Y5_9MICO|nr:hypothetical protein [Microbacterium murale]
MRIRFRKHHFEAAPLGTVGYEYATDKAEPLIGGTPYCDERDSVWASRRT